MLAALTERYSIEDVWMWDNRAVGTYYTMGGGCVRFGQTGQADVIGMVRGVSIAVEVKTPIVYPPGCIRVCL